ncbi:MAG: hypothetical protein Q4C95_07210 [Planctomycetia bacterium]|nr:hypothetical protein [Planctomycetia bacterium]
MPTRVQEIFFETFSTIPNIFGADVFFKKPRPNAVQDVESLRNGKRNYWLTEHRSGKRIWNFCFFLLISMGIGLIGCHYFSDQEPKSSQEIKSSDDLI